MGGKVEPEWAGYAPETEVPTFKLDSDLEEIVERFGLVHEMWANQEKVRYEEDRGTVDATPFKDYDLAIVEFAFRTASLKAERVKAERKRLHGEWIESRKLHTTHNLQLELVLDRLTERYEDEEIPEKLPNHTCQCERLWKRVRTLDKRLWRLGRVCGYIRHALYIRGQYRTGVEVAEWTGDQILRMNTDRPYKVCECWNCTNAAELKPKLRAAARGRERDEFSKELKRKTRPYSWAQQERDMKKEEEAAHGNDGSIKVKGKRVTVFGTAGSVDIFFS